MNVVGRLDHYAHGQREGTGMSALAVPGVMGLRLLRLAAGAAVSA